MSRYNDPAVQRERARGRKASDVIREFKRREAAARNEWTAPERRRAARRRPS